MWDDDSDALSKEEHMPLSHNEKHQNMMMTMIEKTKRTMTRALPCTVRLHELRLGKLVPALLVKVRAQAGQMVVIWAVGVAAVTEPMRAL